MRGVERQKVKCIIGQQVKYGKETDRKVNVFMIMSVAKN